MTGPKKLLPPEHLTEASEARRAIFDGIVGGIPGGSFLAAVLRRLLPSEQDEAVKAWRAETSARSNAHGDAIAKHEVDLPRIKDETADVRVIAERADRGVDELRAGAASAGQVATPHDGVLQVFTDLVRQEKFATALGQIEQFFGDNAPTQDVPALVRARARSLMGTCLWALNRRERAAMLFVEAYELDGADEKVRSNAVVGLMVQERFDEAIDLALRLTREAPASGRSAANLIYARKAAGHEGDPLSDISGEARATEDVRVAHIEFLHSQGDMAWREHARSAAARFPESREAGRQAAEALLEEAIEVMRSHSPEPDAVTRAIAAGANAAEILHAQWRRLAETERAAGPLELALLHNAVVAYRLADRPEEAAELMDAERARLPEDENLRRLAAVVALEAGRQDLLQVALEQPFDGDAVLHCEAAIRRRDWSRALELIRTRPEEMTGPEYIDIGVIEAVIKAMAEPDRTGRVAAFDALVSGHPPDPSADLVIAVYARQAGANEAAETAFRRAAAAENLNHETRLRIADEARARSEHGVVIELLEGHVDPGADRPERDWLAHAHASSKPPRATGWMFFERARRHADDAGDIHLAEGHYHLNRHRPADAVPCLRRALRARPRNARRHRVLWKALMQAGDGKGAEALVRGIDPEAIEGDPQDRLWIAQLMWRQGRGEAFDFAYRVASAHRDHPEACLAYTGLFFLDAHAPRPLPFGTPTTVGPGAGVRLEGTPGKILSFVVVDEDDGREDHRSVEDPIVRETLGKVLGDTFEVRDGPLRTTWRVAELKPKYLHLLHAITGDFNDRFPGRGGLWTITIAEDDIGPVIESAKERAEQAARVVETYKEDPMPLGLAAQSGNGTAIDFAVYLARTGEHVMAATGATGEEQRDADAARAARATGVVLDTYTAWLLTTLNLLPIARAFFARLVVPASAVAELDMMIDEMVAGDEPRRSLAYENGSAVLTETPPEVVAEQRVHLKGVRDAIAEAAEIVGTEAGTGLGDDALTITAMIGPQADAAVVAHREGLALLSADLRMRQLAGTLHGVPAVGMKGLLLVAKEQELLTHEDRSRTVLDLVEHGHAHIGLDVLTLLSILNLDETPDLRRFAAVAAHFGTPTALPSNHIAVAAAFAGLAWHEQEGSIRAQRAIGIVLGMLVRMREVRFHHIVQGFARGSGSPLVGEYVASWVTGHFLVDRYLTSRGAEDAGDEAPERHPQEGRD